MEPHKELLQAIEGLAHDHNFAVFIEQIELARNECVREASSPESIDSTLKTAAILGEVRAYQLILDTYGEYATSTPVD